MADSEARLRVVIDALNKSQAGTKALLDDLKGIEKQTEKTRTSLKDFVKDSDKLKSVGDKMTLGVTLPFVGVATAATKLASDLGETRNKTAVVFGEMSDDIQKWAEGANKNLGQTQRQALDGAADFAIFGKSAKLAGRDLTAFAESNVELASDLASFFNTSPDEAIQAIGAAFRGEAEPIRKYGVLINDAALKDEALRQGLIKTTTDALTPQQRVLAAHALILQQTSDAQGDFARTSDGLANSTRITKAQFEDALATLGEKFLPIAKQGVDIVSALIDAFTSLPDEVQNVIIVLGALAAAMGPALSIGGRMITVFSGIRDIAAGVGGGIGTAIRSIKDVSEYLKVAGVSGATLKDSFIHLKNSGALLGPELLIIAKGLEVIFNFLDRMSKAAQASTDDLIKMSQSADWLERAAASTEILTNSQERLKQALDGVNASLQNDADGYAAYAAGVEGAAKAAGYQINTNGDLVVMLQGMGGVTEKLIQANYRLSESEFELEHSGRTRGEITKDLIGKLGELGTRVQQYHTIEKSKADNVAQGISNIARNYQLMGEAAEKANKRASESMERLSIIVGGQLRDDINAYNEQQAGLRDRAAEIAAELDNLNAVQGRAVTTQRENSLTAAELNLATQQLSKAQSDLSAATDPLKQAELAVKVEDLQGKINGASGAVTSYVDNSKKIGELNAEYDGINKAIANNAAQHEDATKRILFGFAQQQIMAQVTAGTISSIDASKALNKLAEDFGLIDTKTAAAFDKTLLATQQLAEDGNIEAWRTKMGLVYDEVSGKADTYNASVEGARLKLAEMGIFVLSDTTPKLNTLTEKGVAPTTKAVETQTIKVDLLTGAWGKIPREVRTDYYITTHGEPPVVGSGNNKSQIPSRASGGPTGAGGLFRLHPNEWVLSADQRLGRAPIPSEAVPSVAPTSGVRGGDNYQVYLQDTLATKMFLEEKRMRDLAEIEAAM